MKTTIFFLIAFVFFINNISAQTPPSGITVAGGNGAGGAANQLSYPSGVFVDLNGNIYIGDAGNSRVQKWAPNATEGITVAGGNGKGNAANQLGSPSSLFVDANGNIYVLDNLFTQDDITSRVQKWAPNATEGVTVAGGNGRGYLANQLNNPKGIWVDNEGNVYVADHDNGRVQKWAPNATEGTFLSEIYGTPPNSLFILPSDIFIDNSGNYYIVDGNHRIIKWSSNLGTVAVIAGGEYGGGAAQFRFPQAVFVDKFGNVYVADDGNNRIQMWAPNATEGKTVAVGLNRPWDVFVDRDGYIYVADPGNHRIQKFPPIETFQPIDLTTPLRFGGGLSTLHVGTSYNLTASLKNSGNTTWAGDIYLKVNNGTPTLLAANQTIAAGATINLNGNFLPQMEQIGSNVPIELLTKQGSGNFETVEAGDGTVNPIVVNIEQLQVQTSPMLSYAAGTSNRIRLDANSGGGTNIPQAPQTTNSSQQTLTLNGIEFMPNSPATLTITGANYSQSASVGVGANGQFTYPITVDTSFPVGNYIISATDNAGRQTQLPLTFSVLPGENSFDDRLIINNVNVASSTSWLISWTDYMWRHDLYYPLIGINRSYRYKIEYGKVGSNGDVATWYNAGLFPANATATASLQTTQNFNFTLLSNQANSSGSYRIRVTDQLLPRRFALTIVR